MELYDVVLFLHITVFVLAFALTGAIHVSEWFTVRAATVQEMRVLARPQKWGILFAPVVALLLLLGGWLVQLSDDRAASYEFGDGWVWTAVVVLGIAFVAGFGVEGPAGERLGSALASAQEGPPTPELRALASQPLPWVMGWIVPFMILGVVSNMVNKPGAAVSILVIAVGALVGAALGWTAVSKARAFATSP
jgi:hypothetical protein